MAWKPADLPDQSGRTFVVTGANSGIGYHAARHLVQRGAHVVLACRRLDAARRAAAAINAHAPNGGQGHAIAAHLDLADLESVDRFVAEDAPQCINVLVNNAGIMMVPFRKTKQGYESQWGVNVVGHAHLTHALLPRLTDRVVTVSSIAHRHGRIDPQTFRGGGAYDPWRAYGQSKLGDLVFALELQRHFEETGSRLRSVAAHPGVSLTRLAKDVPWYILPALALYAPFLQSGDKGSWPTLYAATENVPGGTYWGPGHLGERRGPPAEAEIRPHALDAGTRRRVWQAVWPGA